MTAVIHHGPPGSYKTFALIQRIIIPALEQGRTVCHNIRGLDSLDRIATAMEVELPPESKLISVQHDSQAGFDHMARFFQWAPIGALIVMDEGQRVYPTRLRSLSEFDTPTDQRETLDGGVQRPWNVENAFDQHRHMNWDIYISTTNVAKIHKEVRAVVEYAFRHRDMAGVLPWYKNKWREFRHDAETSGKSVSHYIGEPHVYTADTRVFECYQSTATGEANGSNENKSIFKDPKLRVFIGIVAFCVIYFVYSVIQVLGRFDVDNENDRSNSTAPPYVSNRTDNDQPDGTPRDNQPDITSQKAAFQFLQYHNPDIRKFTIHQYPMSDTWRLSGTMDGRDSVALITDGVRTVTLPLHQSCSFITELSQWICWFENALVARYTGAIPHDQDNDLPDLQPLQPISAQL